MFETSVVPIGAAVAPRKASVLGVSFALHSLAGIAVLAAGLQSISFPKNAPNQFAIFLPTTPVPMPEPLGSPNAGPREAKPAAAPAAAPRQQTAPADAAPQVIPATTIAVEPGTAADDVGQGGSRMGDGTPTLGSPNGDPNAVAIGQAHVETPAIGPMTPGIGGVQAARVLHRVDPIYPRAAVAAKMSGLVKIHCVIDKDGRIRDPQIEMSTFNAFNQPTIDAVRQWTFAPGSLHGSPVDTYFELTVTFAAK